MRRLRKTKCVVQLLLASLSKKRVTDPNNGVTDESIGKNEKIPSRVYNEDDTL